MVSKVAVIALVAIISVPILLGYAMNLTEVTVTDYKDSGDSVNVTPLYQNGTGYSYAEADIYNLNTNFTQGYWTSPNTPAKIMPKYQATTTSSAAMPVYVMANLGAGQFPATLSYFISFNYFYLQSDWDGVNGGYLIVQIFDESNNVVAYQGNLQSFYWDVKTQEVNITYFQSGSGLVALHWPNITTNYTFRFSASAGYNSTGYVTFSLIGSDTASVDMSKGFRLTDFPLETDNSFLNDSIMNNNKVNLRLPEYPNNVLMTMDLNTITASSYDLIFELQGYGTNTEQYTLRKTTDGSGVHWKLYLGRPYSTLTEIMDLYYDSGRLSNTYQIYVDNTGMEFRYVGNWPTLFGPANVYKTFRYDRDYSYRIGGLKMINFWNTTPVMRVDASEYRAFEYPIIEDQAYNPADFKTNPATTLSGNMIYGRSLTFGSNTYTVTDGNITLGSHKVPVKGMVLDSIPNENGNYDNRINGTKVSESANPATITFNGKWSASISTIAQESYTYNKTEWHAGEFGWDGIDQNFLIVGLITCLGVFIALGIYARKRGTGGIIPLMIVVGGAAMVFFVML